MFSHELIQGLDDLLSVELFNKLDFTTSTAASQVSGNPVWSKIPLGWCEMAIPELQIPSARVAPASYSPVQAVCSFIPTSITDNIWGIRGGTGLISTGFW